MALKKSVVVLCRGFFCRLRQCMNKLLLRRRNIPITRMDLGSRTRHWSSRWETSSRWCRPLSMPQAARLSASHCAAFEHQLARGLVLSVQGVEADFASVQVELFEELAGDGDFVGLGVHQCAAQVMLAGHGDGGE